MCGISGFLRTTPLPDGVSFEARVRAMSDALVHRGPDAGGAWTQVEEGVALGHRRLSILDLSPAGAQPMHAAGGRYVLVFNGEIYNFADLRTELAALGARFNGHSDTEVLLAGFEQWGVTRTLERANGMFAIALWDREQRVLHLARDRFGEKPLYYGWHDGSFLFASELKAFHVWPGFRPALSRAALTLFLRHNYVPDPHCVFEGLHKLPAGTCLSLRPDARETSAPRAYWTLADAIARGDRARYAGTPAEAVDTLDALLRRAVGQRMVADVPLGAFLSGGIDSSTVVALMQAQSVQPVRTFSIGFTMPDYDEAPHARAVAAHLGTAHTELYVSPDETQAVIPRLAEMYDEPFADSSQIPTFLVSQLARQHVTVAMSGDAGDELFAGYTRYTFALDLWRRVQRLPPVLRHALAQALRALPPARWDALFALLRPVLPGRLRQPMAGDKLHKLARLLSHGEPMQMYLHLLSQWLEPERIVLGAHEPSSVLALAAAAPADLTDVERMTYLDTLHYLPGDILAKVDRASMAVSLEARVPLLDVDVAEFAWAIPEAIKLRHGQGKWPLREVLARYVPRALFERPKMGFGIPVGAWLRGPLRPWAEDLLDEGRLRAAGCFDARAVRAAWQAHLSGSENLQAQLWCILMFEAWRARWQP